MNIWTGLLLLIAIWATPLRAVELRYKFKLHEKLKYRDSMALAVQNEGMGGSKSRWQYRAESRLVETVKQASDDSYTLEIETVENKSKFTGPDGNTNESEEKGKPERVNMTHRGRVTERKTLGPEDDKQSGMGYTTKLDEFAIIQQVFDGLTLPEGEVEPGATWSDKLTVDLTPDDKKVRTQVEVEAAAEFRRLVTVLGDVCAEIVTDFTVPLKTPKDKESVDLKLAIEGKIIGHMVTYFSVARGRAVVELGTIGVIGEMTMAPEGMGKTTMGGRMKFNLKTVLED